MRLPIWLGWLLLAGTVFTAGWLRQSHDRTPASPFLPPLVGSLLFAGLIVLLLVAWRERSLGVTRGKGIRLGSLTPLMLILLIEKWISSGTYSALFHAVAPRGASDALLDAYFKAFIGIALVGVCIAVAWMTPSTRNRVIRMAHPARWPIAGAGGLLIIAGMYLILTLLGLALGGALSLRWPDNSTVVWWSVGGQALLAFAEELYYRGLVLFELLRIAPRLGLRAPTSRRWFALLTSSFLFSIEHLPLDRPMEELMRHGVFTLSLGLLLGIIVLITRNLHFAAAIHAWINWLQLRAAPQLIDSAGEPALPLNTYIAIALVLALVLAFTMSGRRQRPATG